MGFGFWSTKGLSPRGRGNRRERYLVRASSGSIPAWAGEPGWERRPPTATRVYPRVGGGTRSCRCSITSWTGLSPRGRGNRRCQDGAGHGYRSIPAWAGEPQWGGCGHNDSGVYPRVGGGTIFYPGPVYRDDGLSPRGRGNRLNRKVMIPLLRSIPAWAGEPKRTQIPQGLPGVYPRVGGGTSRHFDAGAEAQGLSPRGRGNRYVIRRG